MQNTLFSQLQPQPDDPILGLNEAFKRDPRPEKVNLSVGAYLKDDGVMPLLRTVEEATRRITARREPHAYIPIAGLPGYIAGVQKVLFGPEREALLTGRIATVQTPGGTGALFLAGQFARLSLGLDRIVVSDPTWGNHISIFEQAGLTVGKYPYYDRATGTLRWEEMKAALSALPERTLVLLHACCHNPTGVDLPREAWPELVALVKAKNLVPVLDIAYQGLGDGLDEDAYAPRLFADEGVATIVCASSSKNFALYGQRAGALHVLTQSPEEAAVTTSVLKNLVRSSYSNPPKFAGAVVAEILSDPALEAEWRTEVVAMHDRMVEMRKLFAAAGERFDADLSFVLRQKGMFSFTGCTREEMTELREAYAVYGIGNGRICVAGLNHGNVERTAEAFAKVLAKR